VRRGDNLLRAACALNLLWTSLTRCLDRRIKLYEYPVWPAATLGAPDERTPAKVSLVVLVVVVLAAAFVPFFLPPLRGGDAGQFLPPSRTHLFGSDLRGLRFVLQVLTGARIRCWSESRER